MIVVAALTYRRPKTLARLLDAFRTLDLPDEPVKFLIVDNDPAASARDAVDAARQRFAGRMLDYAVEAEPGIPAARNRALREAAGAGARLLCFVDDDAYPAADWLRALTGCQRDTGAVLVFGPVLLGAPPGLRGSKRLLAASIVARSRFLARYSTRRARHGQVVTSGTGNWLGDVQWIVRNDVWFDDARSAGGGEDSAFRERVRELGGLLAWCQDDVVHELLPNERVSVAYQFRRAVAHGAVTASLGRRPRLAVLRHPLGRIVAGLATMCVPVFGIASFALGLHMVGMGVGALRGARGPSGPYAR